MRRTNIYLDEAQSAAVASLALGTGTSRAAVVRSLIDRGIQGVQPEDLESDLAAIRASAGVLAGSDLPARGPDERSRHLERIARGV